MNYCNPLELPSKYWITSLTYKCKSCQHEFEHLICNENELVKYVEKNGSEVRWLPTYGKGGYLDLLIKLVMNFQKDSEITMKIAKGFDVIFQNYTEKSLRGNPFTISDGKHVCSLCYSKELIVISEIVLENPKVEWMKFFCTLLK